MANDENNNEYKLMFLKFSTNDVCVRMWIQMISMDSSISNYWLVVKLVK